MRSLSRFCRVVSKYAHLKLCNNSDFQKPPCFIDYLEGKSGLEFFYSVKSGNKTRSGIMKITGEHYEITKTI